MGLKPNPFCKIVIAFIVERMFIVSLNQQVYSKNETQNEVKISIPKLIKLSLIMVDNPKAGQGYNNHACYNE